MDLLKKVPFFLILPIALYYTFEGHFPLVVDYVEGLPVFISPFMSLFEDTFQWFFKLSLGLMQFGDIVTNATLWWRNFNDALFSGEWITSIPQIVNTICQNLGETFTDWIKNIFS